jgi:V/A-type H+-transporting ATPase subunit C
MRSLARYGVANAITRTMLSELLAREDFDEIVRAGSLEEAWVVLRKTAYRDWLPEDVRPDPLAMEKLLREAAALRFKRAIRTLKGKPLEVGTILLSRWDLDNLEFAFRLWHARDLSLEEFLTYPCFVDEIPILEITRAETIDEIALALRHTPYFEPVSASAKAYKEKRSVFYVELELEKDYYRRLLEAVQALGGADARKGESIIASEIDILNLSWLARLLQYYEVRTSEFRELMIPGPSAVSRQLASPDLTADDLDGLGSVFLLEKLSEEGKGSSNLQRISELEYMVREMAVDAARRLLAGYPFSITCVLSFYHLKRVELRNLYTVFVGKATGLAESEISTRLYGLR